MLCYVMCIMYVISLCCVMLCYVDLCDGNGSVGINMIDIYLYISHLLGPSLIFWKCQLKIIERSIKIMWKCQ